MIILLADVKRTCPLPFHLTSLRPSTLMLYLIISFAIWATFLTLYRVLMFQVPILVLALIDRGFVGALASQWLSPTHVMSSSCEPFSRSRYPSSCGVVAVSVTWCIYEVELLTARPNKSR